ncbi:Anp1-domain-containing protein [Jimgerdemannia flammicorona]|uniref:Anp1-domain-containing protein n=1 Tax=Jimgerdemannia flammicorona TaxID=994334 RepID=A0A433CZ95_9FUNG|nr:Anp1-domain-containing protein [Jimgerdemannia flammicorona]
MRIASPYCKAATVLLTLLAILFLVWLSPYRGRTCRDANVFQYHNMNKVDGTAAGHFNHEHVLILTPFKEAAHHIESYLINVNKLTYPHHLISLGFLVSDSRDNTVQFLQDHARWFMKTQQTDWERFRSVSIMQKDFAFELSNEDRHSFQVQIKRRVTMSKSRNYLLTSTLRPEHAWVLWLDGDVIEYPETLLEDLIGMGKDIIVPNCWWHSYDDEGGYDRNNWRETPESLEMQKRLGVNDVLVEGYNDHQTHRRLLLDMRYENETSLYHAVELDGVGGTCTLVRAQVHREGAVFPTFPFKHQLETEGLAKMAKSLGYGVWGLPNYIRWRKLGRGKGNQDSEWAE